MRGGEGGGGGVGVVGREGWKGGRVSEGWRGVSLLASFTLLFFRYGGFWGLGSVRFGCTRTQLGIGLEAQGLKRLRGFSVFPFLSHTIPLLFSPGRGRWTGRTGTVDGAGADAGAGAFVAFAGVGGV